MTPGQKFSHALTQECPLQIVGTINAYCALQAEKSGFRSIYLSGAGVANASFGIPDLGMTSMTDVVLEIQRITQATELPLLVDADTGWGHALSIARTVQAFESAGAAAMHIEDQQAAKRCGHRPGKVLVSPAEMSDRIKACVDSRKDKTFNIMARTDALANEGVDAAIDRCTQYIEAGADMIFAEAITDPEQYRRFTSAVSVPVLANMTEFGQSPLMTRDELRAAGVSMILYPLSAFRAMSLAAMKIYHGIREEGSQQNLLDQMQTREALYETLDYLRYEKQIDDILNRTKTE